ncbi:MAG: hypothetical protein CM15mP122_2750 [Bacteroidota bacterium]|nr:MAG: hypothetical protein CM15mP122_2750 [Bacteroidota bacterium]
MNNIIQKHKFRYVESGAGQPIIILHGLMGGLSNFSGVMNHFQVKISCNYTRTSSLFNANS